MYKFYNLFGTMELYDRYGEYLSYYSQGTTNACLFLISPVTDNTYSGIVTSGYAPDSEYACPVIDVSGATIVNDAYDSEYEHISVNQSVNTLWADNQWRMFRCYEYVPEESGKYVLFFDNIVTYR